jgi:hypothetical protein
MKSIKNRGLEPKKGIRSKRIFKTSLTLLLIVFAFTMSSPSSFFQIVKPVAAAALTEVAIVPSNNIVNTRSIYEIFFKTATAGTIKFIQMTFPSGSDVSAATRLIEKGGIGSGTLSAPSSTTLIYTVSNPVSVPAGTTIRLEIGRVINSNTAGSFKVGITTKDMAGGTIDGPTLSASFPIKDITGNDVSPSFMIRKTLHDDDAGHAHGWDPNDASQGFVISDSDIDIPNPADTDKTFVDILLVASGLTVCSVNSIVDGFFSVFCSQGILDGAELHYIITKLPPHLITSSASASSTSSSQYESLRAHDQIASEFP